MRRWIVRLACVVALLCGALFLWQWTASEAQVFPSKALGAERPYRVFNPDSRGPVVYALDGQNARHGLIPAAIFSASALIQGKDLPKVVAIASGRERDNDFRRAQSKPAAWRPRISGQSEQFDRFLINEIIPAIEGGGARRTKRFLMGHSLAGLYALDLGTRYPGLFDGIFTFAPTFSHDLSIVDRLALTCRDDVALYTNWGWESARDTAVFDSVVARWKTAPECARQVPVTSRHFGAFHQIIMLTGQIEIAWRFLD